MRHRRANSIQRKPISLGEPRVFRRVIHEVTPRGLKPAAQKTITQNAMMASVFSVCALLVMPAAFGGQESNVGRDEHQAPLERLVGLWNCIEYHFNEIGEEVAQVEAFEQIDWVLDRNVIRRNYSRSIGRKTYRAIGMISWNPAAKRYEGAWFDNVSTSGSSVVMGQWEQAKLQFTFELKTVSSQGKTLTYTVIETFIDENNRESTTYEHRGQELIKRMKVVYQRTAPCPESTEIMIIGPEEEFAPPKKHKD